MRLGTDVRRRLHIKFGGRCAYCGVTLRLPDATIDHVVPRSKGGSNRWFNLVCSCEPCNSAKGDGLADDPRFVAWLDRRKTCVRRGCG